MTDEVDELKNIYCDFKILAVKVNNDNTNKKKEFVEMKELLEMCKKNIKKYLLNMKISKKKKMIIWLHNIIGREKQN